MRGDPAGCPGSRHHAVPAGASGISLLLQASKRQPPGPLRFPSPQPERLSASSPFRDAATLERATSFFAQGIPGCCPLRPILALGAYGLVPSLADRVPLWFFAGACRLGRIPAFVLRHLSSLLPVLKCNGLALMCGLLITWSILP